MYHVNVYLSSHREFPVVLCCNFTVQKGHGDQIGENERKFSKSEDSTHL